MNEDKVYEEMEKQIEQIGEEFRNEVIEEVAQAIEKFEMPLTLDTVDSFAVFVRNMKR